MRAPCCAARSGPASELPRSKNGNYRAKGDWAARLQPMPEFALKSWGFIR